MSKFIYGLNVNKSFSDIPDPEQALENLGLDIRDLDIIRGMADAGVTKRDVTRLSGLDVDARSELSTIYQDLLRSTRLVEASPDIRFTISSDHIVNNKLKAKSFKYNYINYNANNAIVGADISTSRVSSWSSFEDPATATSPIFYGGDVEIIPNANTGSSQIKNTTLDFSGSVTQRRFAAEVPTHLVTIDVGGVPKQVYAMKGIPITWEGYFKNIEMLDSATSNVRNEVNAYENILPTWTITNVDNGVEYAPYQNVPLNYNLLFSDSRPRPRKLSFYYPPDNIRLLRLRLLNLTEWTNTTIPNLATLDISFNDIRQMPLFNVLTPNLLSLNVSGNNMTRATDEFGVQMSANTQLSILPTSLTSLTINGCFSDNSDIDLSYLTNLQGFSLDSSFDTTSTTNSRRRFMTFTGSTPVVNSNSIVNYTVTNQNYTTLHSSVTSSPTIRRVNIVNNNIISDSDGNEISFNNNANSMISFASSSNSHNVVNLSGHANLTSYSHTYSRTLQGNTSIEGIFTGCDALQSISFFATDVTGNFNGALADLGELISCDVRFTRLYGNVTSSTFRNATKLRIFYIAGGFLGLSSTQPNANTTIQYDNTFDSDAFYDAASLVNLFIYDNPYIIGNIPDLSRNSSLAYLYIQNVRMTGGLTSFTPNRNLQWLIVRGTRINQPMPQYTNASFRGIYLNNNLLHGLLPEIQCQNLIHLYLNNNNLGKDSDGNIDTSLGKIPSFASSRRLQFVGLNNNFFTSYEGGAFLTNTSLRVLSLANNLLTLQDGFAILSDLKFNWGLSNRSGVRIDLRGNPGITEDAILNDFVAGENLLFLRSKGWSIFI